MGASVTKNLGPVYFNAIGPAPKLAFHTYDQLTSGMTVKITEEERVVLSKMFPTRLTIELPPGEKYRVPQTKGRLVELVLTDPNCILLANGYEKLIGAGTFTFIKYLMPCCDVDILHLGPFEIAFYDLDDKYLSTLSHIGSVNFYLPGKTPESKPELWGYKYATMARNDTDEPLSATIATSYNAQYEKSDTTSCYVYSYTIGELQKHPILVEMEEEWGLVWDRDLIRESAPPCIALRVKVDKLREFIDFAKEVCPDMGLNGFDTYDRKEIYQPPEEKKKQEEENLGKIEKDFEELLASGLIYR